MGALFFVYTQLLDHDVLDGAPMARFINQLTKKYYCNLAP